MTSLNVAERPESSGARRRVSIVLSIIAIQA